MFVHFLRAVYPLPPPFSDGPCLQNARQPRSAGAYWDTLGSVWHMLGYVGPILGLCRAYVKPIEPILRPILSQENHV